MKPILINAFPVTLALLMAATATAQEATSAAATVVTAAQQPAQPDDAEVPVEDVIIVTASRLPGQVDTDVPPVVELDEADIAAVGASSLEDLIAQLAPQTGSGRGRGGRPVFLVNGQRVSSFREMHRYPPEAIRKVEVYPEEVALKYGYPADQRVINFVLKDNFASREVEVDFGGATAGGRTMGEFESSLLTINGPQRLSLGVEYDTSTMLTEAERDIIQTEGSQPDVAGDPDPARYRSLAVDAETLEIEGTWNTGVGEGADASTLSVNATHTRDFSRSLSGLDTVLLTSGDETALRTLDDNPLERRTRTITSALASSFNKPVGDWNLAVTADGSLVQTDTAIDRRRDASALQAMVDAGTLAIDGDLPFVIGAGRDRSSSDVWSATTLATLRGTPIRLPGGAVSVTIDSGYSWNRIASNDTRTDADETVLKRGDLSAGLNLGIPIASAREGFLEPLGELSLNLGGGIDHLSDFGTLTDWTAGVNWSPTPRLSLQASYTMREAAPGLTQLGDPQIVTPNVSVYDFATGDTVLATITTGGNPFLVAETQRDIKLSASYDLDLFDRANVLVEYYRNRSDDVTESFPLLTPAIEAAFPDRVQRDADGRLIGIDRRPVTFAERNSSRIRYGFNIFGKLGKPMPQAEGGGRGGMMGAGRAPEPAPAPGPAAIGQDAPPAGQRPGFDPQRMEAVRQALCAGWDPNNPSAPLPDLSALPERFLARLKGPDGQIDPARVAELRNRVCAMQPQGAGAGQRPQGERRGGGGGPGMMPFGRGGDGQGRWSLSVYHSIELENEALIAAGVPVLDLLNGGALGSGGVSRHKLELEGGMFFKGMGFRLRGNYASSTRVDGSGQPGSSDLFFHDIATFNVRLFANLEEQRWLVGNEPGFFKGTRVSLGIDNIFDATQRVTDNTGAVPLSYQPGLVNPVGRTVEIDFRKVF